MTKSLLSALTGTRVADGCMQLDDRVAHPLWNATEQQRRNITVQNLLQQTSGISWREEYYTDADGSEVAFGQDDTAAFVAKHGQRTSSGGFTVSAK